jgi:DNA-binding LacI/PurR family transcriptional regulator
LLKVPLTTISWSTAEMGETAARMLLESIDGEEKPKRRNIVIAPHLVIRGSCGSTV